MNILIHTSSFLPSVGGAELAIHYLAEGLVKIGHKVTVCTFNRARKNPIVNYDLRRIKILAGLQKLRAADFVQNHMDKLLLQTVQDIKPDIVHSYFSIPCGYNIARIKQKINIPTVLTCQGADIQKCPEISYGYRLNPRKEKKIKYALLNSDALVAISSNIHAEYQSLGVEEKRIFDIPNPIDYERLRSMNVNKEAGATPMILAVGRNHLKKGFKNLIKIMAILKKKGINARCVVVGRGANKLKGVIKKLNLQDRVEVKETILPVGIKYENSIDNINGSVDYYFSIADIYAMLSFAEGFGLVTVEAMAAGNPVVAMKASGSEDLVFDGQNGFIVENYNLDCFAEKLIELINNPLLREKLGGQGRQFSQKYSSVNIAREHELLYKKLLSNEQTY